MNPEDRRAETLPALAEWLRYLGEIGVEDLRVLGGPPARTGPDARMQARASSPAVPDARPPASARPASKEIFGLAAEVLAGTPGDPAKRLREIREELGDCARCKLCHGRTQIVFGVGNPNAGILFVGEGPGADEDAKGEPFVGRAGQKLNEMIRAIGLRREDVYIANVVKCRPPDNRTPEPDEVATCSPFLFAQIEAIRPKVIVALGSPATRTLLGTRVGITELRGTWGSYRGIPVMPTFHPAYLLRAYTVENRRSVFEDLKAAKARMEEAP